MNVLTVMNVLTCVNNDGASENLETGWIQCTNCVPLEGTALLLNFLLPRYQFHDDPFRSAGSALHFSDTRNGSI